MLFVLFAFQFKIDDANLCQESHLSIFDGITQELDPYFINLQKQSA